VLVLVAVLAACSSSHTATPKAAKAPKQFQFVADVRLNGAQNVHGDLTQCVGVGKFADVKPGARVTVTSPSGKVLKVGYIKLGLGTNLYKGSLDQCNFRYYVTGVPTQKAWVITIGRSHATTVHRSYVIYTSGHIGYSINGELVTPTTTAPHAP
jgi:hypothetical protein